MYEEIQWDGNYGHAERMKSDKFKKEHVNESESANGRDRHCLGSGQGWHQYIYAYNLVSQPIDKQGLYIYIN